MYHPQAPKNNRKNPSRTRAPALMNAADAAHDAKKHATTPSPYRRGTVLNARWATRRSAPRARDLSKDRHLNARAGAYRKLRKARADAERWRAWLSDPAGASLARGAFSMLKPGKGPFTDAQINKFWSDAVEEAQTNYLRKRSGSWSALKLQAARRKRDVRIRETKYRLTPAELRRRARREKRRAIAQRRAPAVDLRLAWHGNRARGRISGGIISLREVIARITETAVTADYHRVDEGWWCNHLPFVAMILTPRLMLVGTEPDLHDLVTAFAKYINRPFRVTVACGVQPYYAGKPVTWLQPDYAEGGAPIECDDGWFRYNAGCSLVFQDRSTAVANGVTVHHDVATQSVSIAFGSYSRSIPHSEWSVMVAKYLAVPERARNITTYDVSLWLSTHVVPDRAASDKLASVIVRFFGGADPLSFYSVTHFRPDGFHPYRDFAPKGTGYKHSLRALIGLPAFASDANVANAQLSVQTRLHDVMTNPDIPASESVYVNEFIALVRANADVTITVPPLAYTEVYERQALPAQRVRNERALESLCSGADRDDSVRVKAFVKAEVLAKPSDPRNISAVDSEHNLRASSFAMAIKDRVLTRCPWYGPGLTPKRIAELVAQFCQRHGVVAATDYSRFDAMISRLLRLMVELPFYEAFGGPDAAACVRAELTAKCTTRAGPYDAHGTRLSGSPFTTDGNTIIAAYIDYRDLRRTMTPKDAYANIGVHYGDDGISMLTTTATATAAAYGLDLKLAPHSSKVPFLGRVYVNPAMGCLSSYQDAVRTLRRFHVVVGDRTETNALAVLRAKAGAYLLQDAKTPVIGDFMRAVLRVIPAQPAVRLTDADLPWGVARAMEHDGPDSEVFVLDAPPECMQDMIYEDLAAAGLTPEYIASCLANVSLEADPSRTGSVLDRPPTDAKTLEDITIEGSHVFVKHANPRALVRGQAPRLPSAPIPAFTWAPPPGSVLSKLCGTGYKALAAFPQDIKLDLRHRVDDIVVGPLTPAAATTPPASPVTPPATALATVVARGPGPNPVKPDAPRAATPVVRSLLLPVPHTVLPDPPGATPGQCLYDAVASLCGPGHDGATLRAATVAELRSHPARYTALPDSTRGDTSYESAVARHAQPSTWGDDVCVSALASALRRPIAVVTADGTHVHQPRVRISSLPPLAVHHADNHFRPATVDLAPRPKPTETPRKTAKKRATKRK